MGQAITQQHTTPWISVGFPDTGGIGSVHTAGAEECLCQRVGAGNARPLPDPMPNHPLELTAHSAGCCGKSLAFSSVGRSSPGAFGVCPSRSFLLINTGAFTLFLVASPSKESNDVSDTWRL